MKLFPKTRSPKNNFLKYFFAVFFFVMVALVLIEVPFRIYDYAFRYKNLRLLFAGKEIDVPFYDIQTYFFKKGYCVWDPLLIWRYKKCIINKNEFNSLGLRTTNEKEPQLLKDNNTYRIIVFGGSHPFGLRVDYEQAYAYKLQELFNNGVYKYSKRVEVVNAAVPGYSTLQVLNLLKYRMIEYKPDLVIVDAGTNDGILLTPEWPWRDSEAVKRMDPFLCRICNVFEQSSFFWYYKNSLRKIANIKKHNGFVKGATRVTPEENRRNLYEIRKLASDNNFKALFLSQVVILKGILNRGFGSVMEPYLDIYAKLKDRPDIAGYFVDINHGSVKGHAEIAELIYEYLISDPGILEGLK